MKFFISLFVLVMTSWAQAVDYYPGHIVDLSQTVEIDKTKHGKASWSYFIEGKQVDAYNLSDGEEYCGFTDEFNNPKIYSEVKIGKRLYGLLLAGRYQFTQIDPYGVYFFRSISIPDIQFGIYCTEFKNNNFGTSKMTSRTLIEKHLKGILK